MFKTLIKYAKSYKAAMILAPVFTASEVIFEILIPFEASKMIDLGINNGDKQTIIYYGAITLCLAFCALIAGALGGIFASRAATGFSCNLRKGIYEHIQTFAFSNIDKFKTSGLVTRMTTDITNIQNATLMLLRVAVRSPVMLAASIIMCLFISVKLSLVFIAGAIILTCALLLIIEKSSPIFKDVFDKYDELNAGVQENVSAIKTVKAYTREKHESERYAKAAETVCRLYTKAEGLLALNNPMMMLVVYGCILAISWFGAHLIVAGSLSTGSLTALFSYVMSMLMSLMMLSMVFVMVTMSGASAKRIADVLDEQTDMANGTEMVIKDGSIDFEDVSFSYNGTETLKNINLHIASGETIGIVGNTGSGKTSLVNLIARLYDAKRGVVKVGGADVKNYRLKAMHNNVAVVLQKNVLFSGTIMDNLRWGNADATDEECIEACKLACADEFIEKMPDGYNTWIERGGANVSGGQRQRLCIARALLVNPKVLILDDSTSAVDTATDAKIRSAFRSVIPNVTKIIISQRSIADADRIIVMNHGEIVGIGTHDELLKTNRIYREIYDSQKGGMNND